MQSVRSVSKISWNLMMPGCNMAFRIRASDRILFMSAPVSCSRCLSITFIAYSEFVLRSRTFLTTADPPHPRSQISS
eukprot:7263452-Prymnesium_polylepis.1